MLVDLLASMAASLLLANSGSEVDVQSSRLRQHAPPPAVLVEAYTESLCIDCKNFVNDHLIPTYKKLGPQAIQLNIVPFGNAKINDSDQTVTCQHGNAECDANAWQQCAFHAYAEEPETNLAFLGCLEDALPMGSRDEPYDPSVFRTCAQEASMDFAKIEKCHSNPLYSWMLQSDAANKTPQHDHVPWVMINGVYMDEEKYDLQDVVCREYIANGGSNPACSSSKSVSN